MRDTAAEFKALDDTYHPPTVWPTPQAAAMCAAARTGMVYTT
jgi:hypothetical protein